MLYARTALSTSPNRHLLCRTKQKHPRGCFFVYNRFSFARSIHDTSSLWRKRFRRKICTIWLFQFIYSVPAGNSKILHSEFCIQKGFLHKIFITRQLAYYNFATEKMSPVQNLLYLVSLEISSLRRKRFRRKICAIWCIKFLT